MLTSTPATGTVHRPRRRAATPAHRIGRRAAPPTRLAPRATTRLVLSTVGGLLISLLAILA